MSEASGIICFWCNETALIGNYFAKRKNIIHKIWISGQDARKENRFVKWIKPLPQDLVAMSDFLKTEFEKNHGLRVDHVIQNAVAQTFTNSVRDIDVIAAGSLIPLKQFEVVVEVIHELKKQNTKINAVIVGAGPQEQTLMQLTKKLDLEKTITFVGEIGHETLMTLMNRAKVLVHPSSYEGYSTVCLEALANGCHVVSFTYAENHPVKNWHIVNDKTEMIEKVNYALNTETTFEPVLVRDIDTTVKKMMALFLQPEALR
jgi:glycosyltransferase involved in cell wall biosynthesis